MGDSTSEVADGRPHGEDPPLRVLLPLERRQRWESARTLTEARRLKTRRAGALFASPPTGELSLLTIVAFETADPSTGSLDSRIAAVGHTRGTWQA
jgi:hypothetical protein